MLQRVNICIKIVHLLSFPMTFEYTRGKHIPVKPLKQMTITSLVFWASCVLSVQVPSPQICSLSASVCANSRQPARLIQLNKLLIRYWWRVPQGHLQAVMKNHCYSTKYWLLSLCGGWRYHYYYDLLKGINLFKWIVNPPQDCVLKENFFLFEI